mmetsp:Transcript_52157/g.118916  ORF Transcript_52157/g.118916 Transcript_52157/m.118916 type:complete len:218 (-) Transcript_52157:795-1448(-)
MRVMAVNWGHGPGTTRGKWHDRAPASHPRHQGLAPCPVLRCRSRLCFAAGSHGLYGLVAPEPLPCWDPSTVTPALPKSAALPTEELSSPGRLSSRQSAARPPRDDLPLASVRNSSHLRWIRPAAAAEGAPRTAPRRLLAAWTAAGAAKGLESGCRAAVMRGLAGPCELPAERLEESRLGLGAVGLALFGRREGRRSPRRPESPRGRSSKPARAATSK